MVLQSDPGALASALGLIWDDRWDVGGWLLKEAETLGNSVFTLEEKALSSSTLDLGDWAQKLHLSGR